MTSRSSPSTALGALAMAAVLLMGGCARAGDKLGAGEDVDFCAGWAEVLNLDEPPLDDQTKVLRWAEGVRRIIERIDLRDEVDDEPVPRAVELGLEAADETMERFVDDVREATSADDVRAAQRKLADSAWDEATAGLSQFEDTKCR